MSALPVHILPNVHLAIVPIEKLRDYALSPQSIEGRHKARVFAAALGLRREDANWLQDAILKQVLSAPCRPGPFTEYGTKYVVDMVLTRGAKRAAVCTAWLLPNGQKAPRLISAYVLPSRAWDPPK